MKIYYHATTQDKLNSILDNGIRPGVDKVVYMCEKAIDAAKFLAVRGIKPIYVISFKTYKKEENIIDESFDHSLTYFKCKAYVYKGTIEPCRFLKVTKYF